MGLVPPPTSRRFRLYRRGAAGSTRDAAAHCNREPRRHRPQLVPPGRQPRALATPRPSATLGVAGKATAGSTYRCPAGGELPAGASRPTAAGTHTSGGGVARREGALRAQIGLRSPGIRQSRPPKKRGTGLPVVFGGRRGTQKPSWEVRKQP